MERSFTFQITPLDTARLRPQVSRALEKRRELVSRQCCPKIWKWTDRINRMEKVPQSVQESRKRRRGFLGLLNWVLGVVLLMPGLMEPEELLFPLLIGAVGFGAGTVSLWRSRRLLLGGLNLIAGILFCIGAKGNFEQLGGWLPLGLISLVIGFAALITQNRKKRNQLDKEAEQLMQGKDVGQGLENMRVCISDSGMAAVPVTGEEENVLCTVFDFVLETEELLLPIFHDSTVILQKKDLLTGTMPELRKFLSEQTQYICLEREPQP